MPSSKHWKKWECWYLSYSHFTHRLGLCRCWMDVGVPVDCHKLNQVVILDAAVAVLYLYWSKSAQSLAFGMQFMTWLMRFSPCQFERTTNSSLLLLGSASSLSSQGCLGALSILLLSAIIGSAEILMILTFLKTPHCSHFIDGITQTAWCAGK